MEGQRFQRQDVIWLAVFFEGGLFLAAAAAAWFFELPLPELAYWKWPHAAWALAATVPLLAAMWWGQHTRFAPLRKFREVVDGLILPMFRECTLLDFALISLLAGVGEEALFRGVIQGPLTGSLGPWPAILLGGLIFGAVHWITTTYAVLAAIIGVYLGWLFWYFDNLLVPMIVHGLYDFVALIYLTHDRRQVEPAEEAAEAAEESVEAADGAQDRDQQESAAAK